MNTLLHRGRWRLFGSLMAVLLIAALAFGTWTTPAQAAPIATWCIVGDWQNDDLNDPTTPPTDPLEWNNNYHALMDDGTSGDDTASDGVFSYSTQLPAGTYVTKAVTCEDWNAPSFPGNNYSFTLDSAGTVTFTLDTNAKGDGWYPDQNILHVEGAKYPSTADAFVAVGDWQSEAGGTDWTNNDPATTMIDDGSGLWVGEFAINTAGSYAAKIQEAGSWDYGYDTTGRSLGTGSGNGSFDITTAGNYARFTLDLNTSRWKVEEVAPLSWCVVGDFQGSWDNFANPLYDDGTNGDQVAHDGIYSYEHIHPTAQLGYNWRVVECGSWATEYPALQTSFYDTTSANQAVRFEFDTNTIGDGFFPQQYITNTVGDTEMTGPFYGVGNWQGEAGNPDGDWDETTPTTQLWDDGTNGDDAASDGIFYGEFPINAVGNYIGRVTINDTWDRYDKQGLHRAADSADFDFSIAVANDPVTITLDVNQSRVKIEGSTTEVETTYCAAGEWQGAAWNPSIDQMVDDGTYGDAVAGDGVYTYEIPVGQQPGDYGWKVAENCQWGTEYPGGFGVDSWYRVESASEAVKLTIDTNDYSGDVFKPDTNILSADDLGSEFVVTGTFQPGGTPDSSDTNFQMVDDGSGDDAVAGDGIYTLTVPSLAQGGYTAQLTELNGEPIPLSEEFGRLRGANPLLVIVGSGGSDVVFEYDRNTDRVHVDVQNASTGIDNNLQWAEMLHDSRDADYRSPGGAIPVDGTDDEVTVRFRTAENDAEIVLIRYFDDYNNTNHIAAMTKANTADGYDYYEYTLPAPTGPNAYYYWFLAIDGSAQAYYQDAPDPGGVLTGGTGETRADNPDYSWQITYYDPAFETPEWVQNAVIYQIFPERFRDGDPSNNPVAGEFFYDEPYGTIVRSLGSDWNTPVCDPRDDGVTDACDNSYSRNFYGGDLQGITEMIEAGYFNGLGVTALYLNPIFESPSNHKYDTFDFMQVDDNFGGKQAYDEMIAAADAAGIAIILDGVFNHASSDSVYFDRYERWDVDGNSTGAPGAVDDNSGACEDETATTSPWGDWFSFFPYTGSETAPCDGNRDYPYWFGIFDSLAVFDSDSADVQGYFYADGLNAVGPYWLDQGAAGWRLDVAPEIDHGALNDPSDLYWEGFRDALHEVDPEAYIVGEEWAVATSWVVGGDNGTGPSVGEWDATMNYQFGAATLSFFRDTELVDNDFNEGSSARKLSPLTPTQWNERMLNLMERYPPEAFAAMMNLFGSHDTNRAMFLLNHDPDMTGNVAQMEADMLDPNYDWSDAIERMKGATLIQMTMPGAPTIYYGNEVGLVGPVGHDGSQWQDDPYNRQPYPWLDESGTPLYTHLQDQNNQDAIYDYFALLAQARNSHPALRTGDYTPLVLDDANMVLAYARHNAAGDLAVVVVNRDDTDQDVTVSLNGLAADGTVLTDLLTGTDYTVNSSGEITVTGVSVNGGALLVVENLPDTPANIAVTYDSDTHNADLTWTAPADALEITIERSKNGGTPVPLEVLNGRLEAYTDDTIVCGNDYTYTLAASNIHGQASAAVGLTVDCDETFSDVPGDLPAPFMEDWVNQFYQLGITQGCAVDPLAYCPNEPVSRGAMAVFILRALNYPDLPYTPTGDAGQVFSDVPSPNQPPIFEDWIEEFHSLGLTQGCAVDPLAYCPDEPVSRGAMAVFLMRVLEGAGHTPAGNSGQTFADVPSPNQPPIFEAWIEEFYEAGITTGCGTDPVTGKLLFCPEDPVTRGAMAVFILRAFDNLPDPDSP